MDSPGLNPDGLNLSDDDLARERTRVKSGTLRKLARIVLFSPDIPEEENKHWSILPVSNLKSTPIDLLPDVRMSDEARLERRKLVYKSSGGGAWESMIFCRVEEGCDKAEVLHLLQEVFQYYVTYTQTKDTTKRYTPVEAYAKLVRRWPDAMFDAYSFPKKGTNYVVRKASVTTLGAHVGVITGPSEVSDSELEEEESETTTTTSATNDAAEGDAPAEDAAPEEVGQQTASDQPVSSILPDGNDADAEVDYDDITNDAVTVGEDDDEGPLQGVDVLKLLQEKIPTSQIMKECFGPDTDEEDDGEEQDVGMQVSAKGVVFAQELPEEPVDENANVVEEGAGDKVPAKEAVTTRRSKDGKPADKGGSADQGGSSAAAPSSTQASSASSGAAAGAGGGGEEPPDKSGGKKRPSSKPAGPSPKKKKDKKAAVSPRSSSVTFMGQNIGAIDDGKKKASTSKTPAAQDPTLQMPPPQSVIVPKKKTPEKKKHKSKSTSPSTSPAGSQPSSSGSSLSNSNISSSSSSPSPPPPKSKAASKAAAPTPGTSKSPSKVPSTTPSSSKAPTPSTSKTPPAALGPPTPASQRIPGGGRAGGKVKSTSPKKSKKKRKRGADSSSSSSSDSSDAGDDVDEILKKAATYKPPKFAPFTCGPGCNCESFNKTEVKTNLTSREQHLILVYIDRTDKARMDQINSVKKYMKKINKKLKAQGTHIQDTKKIAKEAADEKKVKKILEKAESRIGLPWSTVEQISFNCEDDERREKVVRVLQSIDMDKVDRLVPKIFETFIDGKLIGHFYHIKTRVFKKTGRHFDRGEEYFVLPPKFLELVIDRVAQVITDVKDDALRNKCLEKIDNYLAGRRTDQHRMMDAHMILREYRDDVCYWLLVHDEAKLNLIDSPAPCHSYDDPDDKHAWTQKWAGHIANGYRAKMKKECPERRTKQECKDAAEAKRREIRTANFEGFMN